MFSICSLLDCHLAVSVKIGYSSASVPIWSTRNSIHQLLPFKTATDTVPDRGEVGFLLRFYRPSSGLLGAVLFFFQEVAARVQLITEGQNNYKGQERKRFFISCPSP